MAYDFEKLQNGSDIRGVALDTNKDEQVNLDEETVARLAKGFLYLLAIRTEKEAHELRIAVGRDSRLSGPSLENSACSALASCGAHVYSVGLASTPAMFMSTVFPEYGCDGAIMITASHMPMNRNGMKFFDASGGLEKKDITDIITFAESNCILGRLIPASGSITKSDLVDTYAAHLRRIIIDGIGDGDQPLKGLKITVDAGNGAGGFYAGKVLMPLGADVSSSQFLEPDGNFPNHIPNPENKEAIESICEAVKAAGSDLGLIFDTDVDRASAVDEKGNEISRNKIVALAAALVAEQNQGSIVVTDSVTSRELTPFIEKNLGMKHLRFKRGYRNVINKSIELNNAGQDSCLAIETSGHAAYRENYFLDDGAYLAAKIVIKTAELAKQGKKISSLIEALSEAKEAAEFRIPVKGDDFAETGEKAIKALQDKVSSGELSGCSLEAPNYEGVRINFCTPETDGWALLRKSLHDPILPLNIESNAGGGCKKILSTIVKLLSEFQDIDLSELESLY